MTRIFAAAVSSVLLSVAFSAGGQAAENADSKGIIAMDEGHEIFMDNKAPEDRGVSGFTWDTSTHTLTEKVVWEEHDID